MANQKEKSNKRERLNKDYILLKRTFQSKSRPVQLSHRGLKTA